MKEYALNENYKVNAEALFRINRGKLKYIRIVKRENIRPTIEGVGLNCPYEKSNEKLICYYIYGKNGVSVGATNAESGNQNVWGTIIRIAPKYIELSIKQDIKETEIRLTLEEAHIGLVKE